MRRCCHKVVSLHAPQDAHDLSNEKSVSMVSIDTVFFVGPHHGKLAAVHFSEQDIHPPLLQNHPPHRAVLLQHSCLVTVTSSLLRNCSKHRKQRNQHPR